MAPPILSAKLKNGLKHCKQTMCHFRQLADIRHCAPYFRCFVRALYCAGVIPIVSRNAL